jgi:hypothetical protein
VLRNLPVQSNVPTTTPVTAIFDVDMDVATLTTSTIQLQDPSHNLISGSISYNPTIHTATLTPDSPLSYATTYTATVVGGANGVKDNVTDSPLPSSLTWSFTTANQPPPSGPGFPPVVVQSSPQAGAINVAAGSAVTVTFNEAMDAATVNANTILLRDAANNQVADTVSFNAATNTATLTPVSPLVAGTTYTVTVNGTTSPGVKSASEVPAAANTSWSFTTVPMIASVTPAPGVTNTRAYANVNVTFNVPVDPTTLTSSTFFLTDASHHTVPATLTYDPFAMTAILHPTIALGYSATYTATIVGGASGPHVSAAQGYPLSATNTWTFTTQAPPSGNPIVAENALPGTPQSQWDITGTGIGDDTLQGFTTDISVNVGGTVSFKVDDQTLAAYHINIYRLGYYGGNGARLMGTIPSSQVVPKKQPAPLSDGTTGLIDCGNWSVSATWQVPASAVSGVYLADLVRNDTGRGSEVVFIVRNDASHSDVLYQTSDATWEAYNEYGGNSLYSGAPAGRAYAVSYNRPLQDRGVSGGNGVTNQLFWAEFPMIQWLESNGYDVSYSSEVDSARYGNELLNHNAVLSVGHDEYWSGDQRANFEAARNAGVNLAFLSGNEAFWKTRWQASIDGSNTPYRTLVSYKETKSEAAIDPLDPTVWTGTWRDPTLSPPADGGRPENALTGTLFMVNRGASYPGDSINVPSTDAGFRFWRNTTVAQLGPGQVATLGTQVLGYEWDEDVANGFRPAGLIDLSSTTQNVPELLIDNGNTFVPGTATHSLTLYRTDSGALVFGAGTVQWSWGLSGNHDGGFTAPDINLEQATVNFLADMHAQPASLQSGLVLASASTDSTAPTSAISSQLNGSQVQTNDQVLITGTATDAGGGVVAGVEVSTDGGATWHPATGHGSWSYLWVPNTAGTAVIMSRAIDDSGNLEIPSSQQTVTVMVLPANVTPPFITAVNSTFNNTTTATVTWTTDKVATTEVDYGTSPQSLTSKVTNSALVTSHAITLAGLAPDTTYYFRVKSVDQYGNVATSPTTSNAPATFATPGFEDSTVADFGGGTTGPNTYISQTGDGEVILNPAAGAEFSGTSLPQGWTSSALASGGAATVGGGLLTVDGAIAQTTALYGTNRSLEFVATFSGAAFQNAGFGVNLNSGTPWAIFSTGSGGNALFARTSTGTASTDTLIPGNWLGAPHDFLIVWNTTAVNYFIDGSLVTSHPLTIGASMRPLVSDATVGGGNVTVDWMRMGPYAASGAYVSKVFDASAPVTWTTFTWDGTAPDDSDLILNVRMGNTPTPDATWTDFIPLPGSGTVIGARSRYIQYSVDMETSDPSHTPTLRDVYFSYTTGPDTVPPTIRTRSPVPGVSNVGINTPVSVEFSELMNPATINTSTFQLFPLGSTTPVPATVTYSGSTAVLQPTAPLALLTTYQVVVSGSITDSAGNPIGSNTTWTFTTQQYLSFADTTSTDFGSGTPGPNIAVTQMGDGELILAPAVNASFTGSTLPPGWTSTVLNSGGTAKVGSGYLTLDGAMAGTSALFGPGRSLDFVAIFSGDPYEHVGFGVDFSGAPWSMFSTGSGGALHARVNNGTTTNDTLIPGNWLGSPHHFRIDWTSTGFVYWIDGAQVASNSIAIASAMRPLASDYLTGGGTVAVNWNHLSPYAPSGTFVSRVYDAGAPVTWSPVTWDSSTPDGTSVTVSVRMGNTPTPDSSWTDFIPLAGPGATIGGVSRYIQYSVTLASTDPNQTPVLQDISLQYTTARDTVAPRLLSETPAAQATGVTVTAPVVVKFSEPMNPSTISNATFHLRLPGGNTDLPATVTYSGSTAVLQPSAPLGLLTTYQVTVSGSVADSSGNPIGSDTTWTFTTQQYVTFTDTAAADFAAGTTGAGTYVSQTGDGEVILAPAEGAEFSGSSLPADWTSTSLGGGSSATVGGGRLTVDGDRAGTSALFGQGRSLDFVATFSGDAYQHAGLGTDLNNAPWAIFSTGSGGVLSARTNNGSTSSDVLLPGNWLGSPHHFRIDWTSTGFVYWIDGAQVASNSIAITGAMRPLVDDNNPGGGVLTVDWVRLSPYAASASYLSRVIDAGAPVTWSPVTWDASTPAGTSLSVLVRMGNTPTPDSSWTAFIPVASSGSVIGGVSRYVQYRADLSTTDPGQTPALQDITIQYTTKPDTVAPTVATRLPAPGATNASITAPVTIGFSELMNPATINSSTVTLAAAGGAGVPATLTFSGSTAVLQPTAPLASGATYQVTVSGTITDASGNPIGSNVSWTFTTAAAVQLTDTTAADFAAGTTGAGTYVSQTGDGEVILAPAEGAEFSGSSLPADWTSTSLGGGGSATVGGGRLTVDGDRAGTSALYGPGRSLDFVATFSGDPYQHIGLSVDLNGAPWAIFSTGSGGALYARTNNGSTSSDTQISGNWLGSPHHFRIDWTSTGFVYWIDGTQVASNSIAVTSQMRPLVDDNNPGGGVLTVDWMRLTPYAASGTFVSRVIDAGSQVSWLNASWDAALPAGTSLTIQVRTGNTPTPDGTWTAFTTLSASGASIGASARYLQYEAQLATTAPGQTPALQDLTVSYSNSTSSGSGGGGSAPEHVMAARTLGGPIATVSPAVPAATPNVVTAPMSPAPIAATSTVVEVPSGVPTIEVAALTAVPATETADDVATTPSGPADAPASPPAPADAGDALSLSLNVIPQATNSSPGARDAALTGDPIGPALDALQDEPPGGSLLDEIAAERLSAKAR